MNILKDRRPEVGFISGGGWSSAILELEQSLLEEPDWPLPPHLRVEVQVPVMADAECLELCARVSLSQLSPLLLELDSTLPAITKQCILQ